MSSGPYGPIFFKDLLIKLCFYHSFENHDKKYRLVPKEDRRKGPQLKQLNIDLKAITKPSKLPEFLQNLMTYLVCKLL